MPDTEGSPSGRGVAATVQGGLRILLGTDADDFAKSLRSRLEARGCAVDIALSAPEAMRLAESGYDLILLDLEASDLDPLTVLRDLKSPATAVQCPVVLIKGEVEPPHVIQRGFDLGAAGYVIKHRLPVALETSALLESFGLQTAALKRPRRARADVCLFSARAAFHDCPAFMPLNTLVHSDIGPDRMSCSHLRPGTADTWRLYPRCALGDATRRAKYALDQGG